MIILGFNCFGHDSAASLLIDGEIVFCIEEERLTRKKHDGTFPINSIQACLDFANITIDQVDHITFFWKPFLTIKHIPVYFFKFFDKVPKLLKEQKEFSVEENLGMLNYLKQMYALPKKVKASFKNGEKAKFQFHYFEHHLCHAASAFYPSGFENAAILTLDGAGEWDTISMAYGNKSNITKLKSIKTPYSLGAFYQAVSMHLGFKLIEGPGKMMALASYGKANGKIYDQLKSLFTFKNDGTFTFDITYFSYYYSRKSGVSKKFTDLFGPSKKEGKDWTPEEMDLAASAQRMVEEVVLHIAKWLRTKTGSDNLCLAGGVALNSVTNGILAQSGLYKNIFIQPAAGDSGTSIGSALYLYHHLQKNEKRFQLKHSFLGKEYSLENIETIVDKFQLKYKKCGDNVFKITANIIHKNYIVAWYQGRDEFGPRALGNRSILTSPFSSDMKDTLNRRVKFREGFRPFAAIVNEEDCGRYFTSAYPNPYMLLVYGVKPEYQTIMPAITHVDGTVRIQTVNEEQNPTLRKLINAFKALTGYSVLLNTSFNIKGEPIVSSVQDALKSFKEGDIDYLVMGEYIVYKEEVFSHW
jgi:carbamoyltransferase